MIVDPRLREDDEKGGGDDEKRSRGGGFRGCPPRGRGDGWFDRLTNLVLRNACRNSNQGEASPFIII